MAKNKSLYASPEAVEHAFYDALEHADLEGLMALWSDEDAIVHVLPNGPRLIGHEAIRAAWREIFRNGPVHVRPMGVHAIQAPTTHISSTIEQLIVSGSGQTAIVNLMVTNVFLKGPQGWRLALHHASPTPEGGGMGEDADSPGTRAGSHGADTPNTLH